MSIPILICDDSSFAQKQLFKALPEDWDVNPSYAKNGHEALLAIKNNPVKILFLDLNMPEMDGYEVLAALQKENIKLRVIVVSGDIQAEAHKRVMELGALEFLKKPVDKDELKATLEKLGLHPYIEDDDEETIESDDLFDAYREVTNVAMGQAASLLANVLEAFVVMPIPNVNMIEMTELQMAIGQVTESDRLSAVCQGFIGGGLAGEAMLLFSDSSYEDIAQMIKYEGDLDDVGEMELLMDLANVLIGACMKGVAEQFDINLSLSHPVILGRHVAGEDILKNSANTWKSTLAIDMHIGIENKNINVNLLLLFTEDSIARFNELITYVAA